jgi:hypothetical protein
MLASISLLSSAQGSLREKAVNDLLVLIDPPRADAGSVTTAAVALELLEDRGHDAESGGRTKDGERYADPTLAERAAKVVISHAKLDQTSAADSNSSDPAAEQLRAASWYVRFATQYPAAAAKVEPLLLSVDPLTRKRIDLD